MKRPRRTAALCFLVWNERPGCEIDLPKINLAEFDEVFAIDGGSTDGTVGTLGRFGIPVYPQKERGLNSAYWQAVETSSCDCLIVFFPKGTVSVKVLKHLRRVLDDGKELVIASRIGKGGRNEEDDAVLKPRKWGVKCAALLAALLWRREGPILWDVLHGIKAFSVDAFYRMNPSRTGISIDLEMAIRSYRLRLSRAEVPVTEVRRTYGETRFKILPTSYNLLKYLISELRRGALAPASAFKASRGVAQGGKS